MSLLPRIVCAVVLPLGLCGSSTPCGVVLADEVQLPDAYAEVVLDVQGMI